MSAVDLVVEYRIFMQHFNRTEYPAYFRRYRGLVAPYFARLERESISEEVTALLDTLERVWAGHWGNGGVRRLCRDAGGAVERTLSPFPLQGGDLRCHSGRFPLEAKDPGNEQRPVLTETKPGSRPVSGRLLGS